MLFIIWQTWKVRKISNGKSEVTHVKMLDAKYVSSDEYAWGAALSPSLAGLGSTAGQAVAAGLPKENLSKQLDFFALSFVPSR